ncbi:chitinase-3-like protein 1 [Octopus sinensis]|uniref:Chitinase-3-like protein 1 n=1 Tax=Octopus sinensis TaxID=2607531 RepID=A0A7E6EML0_9MOLL|nr:chitinase-3-like protein 1 [Octopus sinensis]
MKLSNVYVEIRVDTTISTDTAVSNNKPDIFVEDKMRNTITFIEVGITSQNCLKQVEVKKFHKYDLLTNELGAIHRAKVKIIPVALTWDGIVSRFFKSHLDSIAVEDRVEAYIQTQNIGEYAGGDKTWNIGSRRGASILFCYYTNWAKYRPGGFEFDDSHLANLCTHIIYAFCTIDVNNLSIISNDNWSDYDFHRITSLKRLNPRLKILLSVGGWNKLLNEFTTVSRSDSNAETFAKKTKDFLKKYNFDGFDIDWEFPTNQKQAYSRLLKIMSTEFQKGSKRYLLTAAVSAGVSTIQSSYDIREISRLNIHILKIRYLDYINLMTYDFYGQFSDTDYVVRYWSKHGAPKSKLLIGLPTYGQGFKTRSKNPKIGDKIVGGPSQGPITKESGILAYIEGKYVKDNGLAGMFVWTLDFDDVNGDECGQGQSPLISQMKKSLNIR